LKLYIEGVNWLSILKPGANKMARTGTPSAKVQKLENNIKNLKIKLENLTQKVKNDSIINKAKLLEAKKELAVKISDANEKGFQKGYLEASKHQELKEKFIATATAKFEKEWNSKKKKAAPKKVVTKKAAPKKVVAKKAAPKKVVAKKAAPKKVVAKKAAPKKVVAKKAAPKKVVSKKTAPKKVLSKKTTSEKVPADNIEPNIDVFNQINELKLDMPNS